ncbi:porin thermoregulatory protein envY [Shigella dysenteriae 1617]|nr:porin thermoregulatory protein envY [Shigella dysenteriae 1617]
MTVTAAKSVMAFRVLTMAVDLCRLTTRTMNVNAGHERTSKARIIHQIQLIRGITQQPSKPCEAELTRALLFTVLSNFLEQSRFIALLMYILRSSVRDSVCRIIQSDIQHYWNLRIVASSLCLSPSLLKMILSSDGDASN